ncbi:UDP-N-acetylglucosamine transporter TMEM241 isoform X3 [Brachyhypopomus gauderio]|uniref:UDP-N-acetylglucosamine transporter TMEM241 isoform X3 n=1 Tax=Brachyhypopomus gauderio TaxID=698409 RepID=UPI004041F688
MNLARASIGLVFCIVFVASYFTNKYVLSVLKFTYPTLFQGWQTSIGTLLLWVTAKLGWVEINDFPRSGAVTWLPGSVLFVGHIYAGSKALSILPIPVFFVLQNVSEVVFFLIVKLSQRERSSWMKIFSENVMLLSAVTLVLHNPEFGPIGYLWAIIHLFCVGAYRVIQRSSKSSQLSEAEQQFFNYVVGMLLLASAAYPTGDLYSSLEFPLLMSHQFHSSVFASALFGFSLTLASVKLKSLLSLTHCAVCFFLAKIVASALSVLIFSVELSSVTLFCILINHAGEVMSINSDRIHMK